MKVENLSVLTSLKKLEQQARSENRVSVAVGFTGVAALKLHEMTPKRSGQPRRSGIGTYWGPSHYGNKFLEGPARQFRASISRNVTDALRQGFPLIQALEAGGLLLQRLSQERVPVEHGDLKRSAFTERE